VQNQQIEKNQKNFSIKCLTIQNLFDTIDSTSNTKTKPKERKKMYIYIGSNHNKYCKIKIGKTENIKRRLAQIKGNNKSFQLHYYYKMDVVNDSQLRALEDIIRGYLAQLQFTYIGKIERLGNDWARVTNQNTANEFIEIISKKYEQFCIDNNIGFTKQIKKGI
jgi:hypothetical protein